MSRLLRELPLAFWKESHRGRSEPAGLCTLRKQVAEAKDNPKCPLWLQVSWGPLLLERNKTKIYT